MGVAAYNRASIAIRERIDSEQRHAQFRFLDDLNALPKLDGAGRPFGPVHFVMGNKGWWALDPDKGSGYLYPTLRQAVQSWRVEVTGVVWSADGPHYTAVPAPA